MAAGSFENATSAASLQVSLARIPHYDFAILKLDTVRVIPDLGTWCNKMPLYNWRELYCPIPSLE